MFLRNIAIKGELQRIAKVVETVGNKGKAAISGGFQSVEMRGESNPGPMTEPSVFYVRSLLAVRWFFCPPSMSQTTDGEHIYSKVPCRPCGSAGKASLLNDAQHPPKTRGVNGAAAHWLILARSSGSESELSAVRFSTYSFVGGIHERTLRSRHASLRRPGHRRNRSSPNIELSNLPALEPEISRYHGLSDKPNYAIGDSSYRRNFAKPVKKFRMPLFDGMRNR